MSESFSRSPPVYSGGATNAAASSTATTTSMARSTPYPLSSSSMPSPQMGPSPSLSYPHVYPAGSSSSMNSTLGTIPGDVYRNSLQTAVLEKIRHRLNELTSLGNAQVDSLKKTEQDLLDGEKQILLFIQNAQQQQQQAQVSLSPFVSPSSLSLLELFDQSAVESE